MKDLFQLIKENQSQFETYFTELVEYNKHVNLTAITEKEEVFTKHFYDSCLAEPYISKNAKVVDIGTGAGFPGLPLKIIRKDIDLHLVDSLNKRLIFLNLLKEKLNVDFLTTHARAEEFCREFRESFDLCVSRAVAKLNTLAEYCLPLVKVGGKFIAYKGANVSEELEESRKAIKMLGGEIEEIKTFLLPNEMGTRNLVIIKKVASTPLKYPRDKNLPKTNPIA